MKLSRPRRPRGRPPFDEPVTPAEQRVLELVRDGLTNIEIADRLGVSSETVKSHISSMLSKLGLTSRKQLARWGGDDGASRHRFRAIGLLAILRHTAFATRHQTAAHHVVLTTVLFAVCAVAVVGVVLRARPGDDDVAMRPVAAASIDPGTATPAPTPSLTPGPNNPRSLAGSAGDSGAAPA